MNKSPVRTFSTPEKQAYEVNKAIVIKHTDTARGWSTALLTIKTTETYLIDAPSWEEWVAKFVPWSIRTLEQLFKADRYSLAEHTGETVIRTPKKYTPKHESTVTELLSGNDSEVKDKPASSPKQKWNDDMGTIIPESIVPMWLRRTELRELMGRVSEIKCLLEKHRKDEDPLYMKVDQSAIMKAEQLHHLLSNALPYCVCGVCEGRLELLPGKACRACNNTGLMSREQYQRLVPEEKQKIRAKGIELRKNK